MNALEFAINMELDSEKFYREQAERYASNGLQTICNIMAEEEKNHADILTNNLVDLQYESIDPEQYSKLQYVFKDMGYFKSKIRKTMNQLEFYWSAMDLELDSIDLYTNLTQNSADTKEREMFEFILEQRKYHYSILDELLKILRYSEDWVESA